MAIARASEHELYYEVHGGGPGLPVVLIMGLATDHLGWERQVPVLARTRRVVVLDNRGVGRSPAPPGATTTAAMAEDVVAVLDAAGIGRAHVVGISLGGAIAQLLAIRHGRRVRSLALLASFARGDAYLRGLAEHGVAATAGAAATAPGGLDEALDRLAAGGGTLDPAALYAFLAPLVFSREYLQREAEALRALYGRMLEHGVSSAGIAAQLGAALAHDTSPRLATIGAPTLVVHGAADQLVPPRLGRALAEAIPNARYLELDGGTHGLNLEHAARLNELLAAWLAEQDPPA